MNSRTAQVANDTELAQAFSQVSRYMSGIQRTNLLANCFGEEGISFVELFKRLAKTIAEMPVTHQQDANGMEAMATLHYFLGASDWYITEKDVVTGVQQAFGYAILNGDHQMAELGYIDISELVACGVELDVHFEPLPLNQIVTKLRSAATV